MCRVEWKFIVMLCVFVFGYQLNALGVELNAHADPQYELDSWKKSNIVIKAEGCKSERSLLNAFDGKKNTFCQFKKLKGSEIEIIFKKPRHITQLGILQGGWGNWAQAKNITILIDDKETINVNLQLLCGKKALVQAIPLNKTVSKLVIKVNQVYKKISEDPKLKHQQRMPWGGFAGIGPVKYKPIKLSFNAEPLSKNQKALILEIESPKAVSGIVRVNVGCVGQLVFNAPALNIKPGISKYTINLNQLKPEKNYQIKYFPCHIQNITIRSKNNNVPVKLLSITRVPDKKDKTWYKLTPQKYPTQQIAGKTWTEGLSYSSAGRFANSTYNGLLSEIVGESWFQVFVAGPKSLFRRQKFNFNVKGMKSQEQLDSTKPWILKCSGANSDENIKISWTHMERKIPLNDHGQLTFITSVLFPGFLISADRNVTISSRASGDIPKRSGAPNENEGRFFTSETSKIQKMPWGGFAGVGYINETGAAASFKSEVASISGQTASGKAAKYIDKILDLNTHTVCQFGKLNGSSIEINFKKPIKIAKLAILQSGWANWSHPKKIKIVLNDKNEVNAELILSAGNLNKGTKGKIQSIALPDEKISKLKIIVKDVFNESITRFGPNMVITSDKIFKQNGKIDVGSLKEPWVLAVWGGLNPPTFWGDRAIGVLFTLDKGVVQWNEEGITLPKGITGISTSFIGMLNDNWSDKVIRKQALLLSKMLRNYPVECKEWYNIENNNVYIKNQIKYYSWGNEKWRAEDYAPIPPLYTWGSRTKNWGKLPADIQGEIITPSGPYTWIAGDKLAYSLPRIKTKHAAFPKVPEGEKAYSEISKELLEDKLPDAWYRIGAPWETVYYPIHWPKAILGYSTLNKDARIKLLKTAKTALENGFSPACWFPRKELFSGREYVIGEWIDKSISPVMFGDGNSAVGTMLYSLYCYAKYSGDWDFVRQNWSKVMDIKRYIEVVNDWATPVTSSRESVLFSGIDMDTISYAGLCAGERMAEVLGKKTDLDRLIYLRAKIGPATALRLNMIRYFDPQKKCPNMWINGFSESGPNFEGLSYKNKVSLDHFAMVFCWQGQQPELFQFLNDALHEDFISWLQRDLVDKYCLAPEGKIGGWLRMTFNQSRTAAHLTCRSWLKDWPRKDIEKKFEIYKKHFKKAVSTRQAGFVSAYYGNKYRIYLINWEPAKLGSVSFSPETRILNAELECDKAFELYLHSPKKIKQVKVDGIVLSSKNIFEEKNNYSRIKIPKCKKTVTISW